MRAVVQRVSQASVTVEGEIVGAIDKGFLVLLGVGQGDGERDAEYLANKIHGLRVFEDAEGKMNLALPDVGGAVLVVSQFTLYGDCRKGRRPSFVHAMEPDGAARLCERVVELMRARGLEVETGSFRTEMAVALVNDGPVTLLLDSTREF